MAEGSDTTRSYEELLAAIEAAVISEDCHLCGRSVREHVVYHGPKPEGDNRPEGVFDTDNWQGFYCPDGSFIDCPNHTDEDGPHHSTECCYYGENPEGR